jgi:hypothetical protein
MPGRPQTRPGIFLTFAKESLSQPHGGGGAVLALTGVPDAFADQVFNFNGVPWGTGGTNFFDPLGLIDTQLSGTATVSCAASICADGTYSFASGPCQ